MRRLSRKSFLSMPRLPTYPLPKLLERNANNLDLVRLVCACLVIFGHAFVIVDDPKYPFGTWDPTAHLGYEGFYSASVAVKVFFFLSGLLVTNSLLQKNSVGSFLIARFFRIWPALALLMLGTLLVAGFWCSNLSADEFFAHPAVYRHVSDNLLMNFNTYLPGVFVENSHPNQTNGAIWSLRYEVLVCLGLLALFIVRALRSPLLCSAILVALAINPFLPRPFLYAWAGHNTQVTYLPACFALGAWFARFKHRIVIGPILIGASIAVFLLLKATPVGPYAFLFSLFVALLYLSALPWIRKLRLPGDFSYGTFLWGFFVQQVVAWKFGSRGLAFNLVLSLAISLCVGALSWFFLEKHAIAVGRRLERAWVYRIAARRHTASPSLNEPTSALPG
jgi:peptidoglycan/LPS O-acetylase OafA/YrhL